MVTNVHSVSKLPGNCEPKFQIRIIVFGSISPIQLKQPKFWNQMHVWTYFNMQLPSITPMKIQDQWSHSSDFKAPISNLYQLSANLSFLDVCAHTSDILKSWVAYLKNALLQNGTLIPENRQICITFLVSGCVLACQQEILLDLAKTLPIHW